MSTPSPSRSIMRASRAAVRGLALSCLAVAAIPGAAEATERAPNIVFMIADDLGYGELGCYGQEIIRTPNIDRIAAEGMMFSQFYSGQAVCAPARCVLMTGRHTGHAYVRDNKNPKDGSEKIHPFPGQIPLPEDEVTVAELLQESGYATGGMGKWGLGHQGTTGDPNRQGFDHFFGFLCQVHAHNHYPRFLWRNQEQVALPGNDRTLHGQTYSQDLFIEEADRFIRDHKDQPFFLYLPFAIPHLSIQVPDESVKEYLGQIEEAPYKHTAYLEHPTPRAAYAAMVTHMDAGVGTILATLGELGLDENTIVFFTSDNGPTYDRLGGSDSDFFGSAAGFRGLKGSLYEGGIRVPLVARWPGRIPPGSRSDHIAAFWDVLPTLCEIAGAKVPEDIDGISFLPTLLGRNDDQKTHEFLYWEFPSYGGQQVVRAGEWKAVRQNLMRQRNGSPPEIRTELYHLASDPAEANDVAAGHPEVVARLEAIMKSARRPSEQFPFPALDRGTAN